MNLHPLNPENLLDIKKDIIHFISQSTRFDAQAVYDNISILDTVLAAHASLDSSRHALIFDDVQLTLVHKYLTGRKDALKVTNNLLSLFQYDQDLYEGGFSGDGLGFAIAHSNKTGKRTFVFLEDHALSHGTTYEALVELNRLQAHVTIVLIDEMDSLLRHYNSPQRLIKSIRISRPYTNLKSKIKTNQLGKHFVTPLSMIRDTVKEGVLEPTIFSQFNIKSHGPFDGNNIKELMRAFEIATQELGPSVIHVRTTVMQKELKNLELPAFKTDFAKPPGYRSTMQALDSLILTMPGVHIYHDVEGDTEPLLEYATAFPRHYHPSFGVDSILIEQALVEAKRGTPTILIIDSTVFSRHQISLLENTQIPLTVILKQSGLQSDMKRYYHNVYDNPFKDVPVFMGSNNDEAMLIIKQEVTQNDSLSIVRLHDNVERIGEFTHLTHLKWKTFGILDKETKGVVISYGPSAQGLMRRVQSNHLNVVIINATLINSVDSDLLEQLSTLNLEVRVYDVENIYRPLLITIQDYMLDHQLSLNVKSFDLTGTHLKYNSKELKTRNKLHIDDVLSGWED